MLIADNEKRVEVLSIPIVQRVLFSQQSVDRWLVSMLKNEKHCEKAISYLEALSKIPTKFFNDVGQIKPSKEYNRYLSRSKGIFKRLSQLEDLIPSMLNLDGDMIEKVATTRIIRLVLDKMISGHFALTIIFFDCLFLGLLILSYRRSVNRFLTAEWEDGIIKDNHLILHWIVVVHSCLFYFCVREVGKIVALSTISRQALKRHLGRVWLLLGIVNVPIILSTTMIMRVNIKDTMDSYDDFARLASIGTALLWISVLSLLKTINMHLATFVLATIQVYVTRIMFYVD